MGFHMNCRRRVANRSGRRLCSGAVFGFGCRIVCRVNSFFGNRHFMLPFAHSQASSISSLGRVSLGKSFSKISKNRGAQSSAHNTRTLCVCFSIKFRNGCRHWLFLENKSFFIFTPVPSDHLYAAIVYGPPNPCGDGKVRYRISGLRLPSADKNRPAFPRTFLVFLPFSGSKIPLREQRAKGKRNKIPSVDKGKHT